MVRAESRIVGFALLSSHLDPIPSTRIASLNLFPYLRSAGFIPEILWEPSTPREIPSDIDFATLTRARLPDVVVFQKIRGPAVLSAVRALRNRGIRTIWCVCDIVDNEMVAQTDATIAVTDFLRDLYDPSLRARIHVVHDGIEDDSLVADSVANATKSPSALLVTSDELNALPVISTPPPGWRVKILGRYPPSRAERLRHIYWSVGSSGLRTAMSSLAASLDPRVSRIPWSPKALARAIRSVQIGIIPVDRSAPRLAFGTNERAWRVKSENRLTLLMAAGLPVIATPIPSYESVVIDGVNGYLASSLSDWRRSFDLLRDADVRREMGKRARASVLPRFSLQSQGERFVRVLNRVVQG